MTKKETNAGTPLSLLASSLEDLVRRIEAVVTRAVTRAFEDAGVSRKTKLLRYPDLYERGIAKSKMTLHRLIRDEGFPAGILITPNSRAWTEEEVDDWIANRPSAKKEQVARPRAAAAE